MTPVALQGMHPAPSSRRAAARPVREVELTSDAIWWCDVPTGAAHSLVGHTVAGTDGRLGQVCAVVHEPGRARLEVRTPEWAGGTATIVVPAGLVSVVNRAAGLVLVNVTIAQLRGAPMPGGSWDDPGWRRRVAQYWREQLCRSR